MKEGIAARDGGDLAGAERAFRAAHAIADLPSSGMALARVLERRGRLLEALAVARGVQRQTPVATWTSASVDGYRQAGPFVSDLERRVASITVEVPGAGDGTTKVELDGEPLKPPVLGVARQVDPGRHTVVVTRNGYEPARETVDLREGEPRRLSLVLVATAGAPPPAEPQGATPAPASSDETEYEVQPLLLGGFIALGVGVAAIGGGVATGLMSQSQEDELAPKCPGGKCPEASYDDLDDAEALATTANILYIAGGVVAAAGVTMLVIDLTSEDEEHAETARIRWRASPTAIQLDGRF